MGRYVMTALAFLLPFAIGMFGNWEINPGHWDGMERGMAAMYAPMLALLAWFFWPRKERP